MNDEYRFIHRMRHDPLMNKRQRKRMTLQDRYEEYKSIVPHPEIFEYEDATCDDPVFYNRIKGSPGVVPIPRCWRLNSGRIFPRGYIKPRYRIPQSIMNTGIPELRVMMKEREVGMGLRERIKEKLYPKLGRSLIDQQVLYSTFFPDVKKPYLSGYGEIFHPGPDYAMKRCSPGMMSVELMEALGIDEKSPPPWLFNMQRYGRMPPSYPNIFIGGLNSEIPEGCSYGYQPHGWGEPLFKVDFQITKDDEPREVIYNENQYTKFIYIDRFEERIRPSTSTSVAEPIVKIDEPGDGEPKIEKRKSNKKNLYDSIKF